MTRERRARWPDCGCPVPAASSATPVELGTQDFVKVLLAQPDDNNILGAPLHAYRVKAVDVADTLSVTYESRLVSRGLHLEGDLTACRYDQRPRREVVWRKSSEHKRFDGRVEDRAASGQGVPCRTGGCAHQDAVCCDLPCAHATDKDLEREDLARKVPDHQNVVDSCRSEDILTLPPNAGLKDETVLHRVRMRKDSVERRIDLILFDVCEKTKRAQVDTEDGQPQL